MSFEGMGKSIGIMRAPTQSRRPSSPFRWVSGWLFLGGLLSSIARLRFTSRSRFCSPAGPTPGPSFYGKN